MSRLLKATFDCEVITPMFLGDYTGNKAEMRIPPLRAEMRFWLRAILGSILNQDVYKTARIEQLIMGGTFENAHQSNIHLRLLRAKSTLQFGSKPMLPHKMGRGVANKNAILPDSKFSVEIRSLKGKHAIKDKNGNLTGYVNRNDLFDISISLFKLTSFLGSIGQRSNRGFGSFSIVQSSIDSDHPEGHDIFHNLITNEINSLRNMVEELIKSASAFSNYISDFNFNGVSKWPILHPDCCRISTGDKIDWDRFIKGLMQNIHNEMNTGKLASNVLGGIMPRQGSTMKVSIVRIHEESRPVFVNFISKTEMSPTIRDFENILEFPSKFHNAQVIKL